MAVLQMRYGKSLIFHLLPSLLLENLNGQRPAPCLPFRAVVIVVSSLNALTKDQTRRSSEGGLKSMCLNATVKSDSNDLEFPTNDGNYTLLKEAK